jgi:hemolysin III
MTTSAPFAYPAYARSERIADGAVHLLGVVLAIIGTVFLIVFDAVWGGKGAVYLAALAVYGGSLILSLMASAFYHMTPWEGLRMPLRRVDHAAIYLKIAGTYTPLVVLIGSTYAWGVLVLVWAAALAGAVAKLVFFRSPGWVGTALYLGLGWASLLLAAPLIATLPMAASVLVGLGGVAYSAGVLFFRWEALKFSNAIWHGFVLAGSGCFYAAITVATFV